MPPAWCDGWFLVKSTSAVVAIDLQSKRYVIFPTDNNAEIYGDCLASLGENGSLVIFTNVDRTAARKTPISTPFPTITPKKANGKTGERLTRDRHKSLALNRYKQSARTNDSFGRPHSQEPIRTLGSPGA